jgi:hypothetical protein
VHSHETADTTLQPFSPGSFADPDPARGAMVLRAGGSLLERLPRWPLWAVLIALGAGVTFWVSQDWHVAPRAATSAAPTVSLAPAQISNPPPVLVSAEPAPAEPSALPSAKPKKHAAGSPSTAPGIPKDLESPF